MNALKVYSSVDDNSETALFLSIIKIFKIVNVKGQFENVRTKDGLRSVISDNTDERLSFLLELANMAVNLGNGVKQLTINTYCAFSHTWRGIVDLVAHLLDSSHEYVYLGHFSSDPIEKMFGKSRQGSGGTYFINVQQILQKVNIKKAKLCFNL